MGAEMGGCSAVATACVLWGCPSVVWGEQRGNPGWVQAAYGEQVLNINLFTFLWVALSFLPACDLIAAHV